MHGMAYATPPEAEQACSKMTRLNFQINHKAPDDLVAESDSVTIWLKASAIAVLAIGATGVGAMMNYGDIIEYLRAIAVRW